jgi:hypothetical protein
LKHFFIFYWLVLLHALLGISGIAGGIMLILRPDGSLLGMQRGWLDKSLFHDYLIPGILLFALNGMLPLFVLLGLVFKPGWNWANRCNIYKNMHWAWTYSLFTGIIAIMWITAQQIMTQYFWIQPVISLIGLQIIICTMWPFVMHLFNKS